MVIGRNILLLGAKNEWMKSNVPKFRFVQKAVKRFMPGEKVEEAIKVAEELSTKNISTTFTYLGENISNLSEGEAVKDHYLALLDKINESNLDIEISLKLTQLGFDNSFDKTLEFFKEITQKAKEYNNNVFIDIEESSYVDKTIEFYIKIKEEFDNVGLCLQSYLYRTMDDIKNMLPINPWIRLVKGAYKEPPNIAFPSKKEVDNNFLEISKFLLEQTKKKDFRIAYGTHDLKLQKQIKTEAHRIGLPKEKLKFQMLFGIKSREQQRLAEEGYNIRTLISYGEHWYPWYMRRLAERPANIGFVLKNILDN